ncbi:hypothetical protein [Sinorhizobium sp. 22678]|uniref:hypothetical protein n=1 Tax=Sinorhizobium sp. 22678 TaxID=3453955 RepID=UPI003F85630D
MSEIVKAASTRQVAGLRMPFGRRGWILVGLGVAGTGLAANWDWLAAAGVAPILLSLAPCAVMCATGYCVMCRSKKPADSSATDERTK